jgi:membrane-associated HD superfamily phosphohydrolase
MTNPVQPPVRLAHFSDVHIRGNSLEWQGGDWFNKRLAGWFNAYCGLVALLLVFFYLFYRDIKRYRPALLGNTKKILLLALLLLSTIALSQLSVHLSLHLADEFHLDRETVGFAFPVSAGAMLACLLLDFHLALGFSYYYGDNNYEIAMKEFLTAQQGLPNEAEVFLATLCFNQSLLVGAFA